MKIENHHGQTLEYVYSKGLIVVKSKQKTKAMKKYLAFDAINHEYEDFDTIKEAQKWLEEAFLDQSEGYHPDLTECKIFELKQTVTYDVIDSKENYKYINEEDIPEGEEGEEVWPHDDMFDEMWQHRFVDVTFE